MLARRKGGSIPRFPDEPVGKEDVKVRREGAQKQHQVTENIVEGNNEEGQWQQLHSHRAEKDTYTTKNSSGLLPADIRCPFWATYGPNIKSASKFVASATRIRGLVRQVVTQVEIQV